MTRGAGDRPTPNDRHVTKTREMGCCRALSPTTRRDRIGCPLPPRHRRSSVGHAVVEVDDTIGKSPLVEQLEPCPDPAR